MKKHHWHVFRHEKLFEKHPQPHYQTRSKGDEFSVWTLICEIFSLVHQSCKNTI
jgi:hypothetical protein